MAHSVPLNMAPIGRPWLHTLLRVDGKEKKQKQTCICMDSLWGPFTRLVFAYHSSYHMFSKGSRTCAHVQSGGRVVAQVEWVAMPCFRLLGTSALTKIHRDAYELQVRRWCLEGCIVHCKVYCIISSARASHCKTPGHHKHKLQQKKHIRNGHATVGCDGKCSHTHTCSHTWRNTPITL